MPKYIHPVYDPIDGKVPLYAGKLTISRGSATQVVQGEVEFQLRPPMRLRVKLVDPAITRPQRNEDGPRSFSIDLPSNIPLKPPGELMTLRHQFGYAYDYSQMTLGRPISVKRLIIHASSPITELPFPYCDTDSKHQQGQLAFRLPGWHVRMAYTDEWVEGEVFPFIIEALPDSVPVTVVAVELLQRHLFVLLSFSAGTEVGLPLTVGLDETDQVVWTDWMVPRVGNGQWRWCPDHLVNEALPMLAQGFSDLADDPTMEKVVDRAINLYLTANGKQPIDARIPVACSALELLAWGTLQTEQWLTTDALGKLTAAASLRLLLQWAKIPIDVPTTFEALDVRRRGLSQPDVACPDAVVKIRNELVHPPKRLAQLAWPSSKEMQQAWRVSMQYVELVVLRLLKYQGQHLSRLQLTPKWTTDTETVPWASS